MRNTVFYNIIAFSAYDIEFISDISQLPVYIRTVALFRSRFKTPRCGKEALYLRTLINKN